jgi:hypothetical protein
MLCTYIDCCRNIPGLLRTNVYVAGVYTTLNTNEKNYYVTDTVCILHIPSMYFGIPIIWI